MSRLALCVMPVLAHAIWLSRNASLLLGCLRCAYCSPRAQHA